MKRQLLLGLLGVVILSAAPALASDTNREDRGGIKLALWASASMLGRARDITADITAARAIAESW